MKAVRFSPFHMYHTQIMSLDINLDYPFGVDSFNEEYSVPEYFFFPSSFLPVQNF